MDAIRVTELLDGIASGLGSPGGAPVIVTDKEEFVEFRRTQNMPAVIPDVGGDRVLNPEFVM